MYKVEVAIIILAAGSSLRMGKSKQLIRIHGESLLAKSVVAALESKSSNTIVVLGANEVEHREEIKNFPISIVSNKNWNKGMGSSLKVGLSYLQAKFENSKAVIVMVCDQPLLASPHLDKLIDSYLSTHKPIIASSYSGSTGVPALFDSSIFEQLTLLEDGQGAKRIIESNRHLVEKIDFPEGSIDLDTPDDVKRFIK